MVLASALVRDGHVGDEGFRALVDATISPRSDVGAFVGDACHAGEGDGLPSAAYEVVDVGLVQARWSAGLSEVWVLAVHGLTSIAASWPADVRDTCGNVFGNALRAYSPPIPATANVLEIGCAEFDALRHATAAWPEMTFTGIDWRKAQPRTPDTAVRIQGDVMTAMFPGSAFDWVFSISAIEHIGLGHYQADPKVADGDSIAMANAYRWLKPGGWMYFDVPWNVGPDAYEVVRTSHRVYDELAIRTRLLQRWPWDIIWSGVYGKGGEFVREPKRLKGGESFFYKAYWLRKG